MATVCPFEVSKFTVTSPSEMKIKKLLPSLTTYLAPTYNTQHPSAFKLLWKKSRKTYWNVKHQAVDLLWKVTLERNSIDFQVLWVDTSAVVGLEVHAGFLLHVCSWASCPLIPASWSTQQRNVCMDHNKAVTCSSMLQKWTTWGQSCRTTVVHSQHINEPETLAEVLRMYVPIYLIKIRHEDIIQF